MRYSELVESRPWKHFSGRQHIAYIRLILAGENSDSLIAVRARYGLIHTGRSRVFHGFFVEISGPSGENWIGEHRYSLRSALRAVAQEIRSDGYSMSAIGLTCEWRESGLSENSGYGYHPEFPNRHVHMLETSPESSDTD